MTRDNRHTPLGVEHQAARRIFTNDRQFLRIQRGKGRRPVRCAFLRHHGRSRAAARMRRRHSGNGRESEIGGVAGGWSGLRSPQRALLVRVVLGMVNRGIVGMLKHARQVRGSNHASYLTQTRVDIG